MAMKLLARSKHLIGVMMQVTECKYSVPVATEIWHLVWQGVVCAHMPCFRRPGHILRLNVRPEKWGGHYASFVAMLRSLHSINKEQYKKLLCYESSRYGKCKRKAWHSQREAISRYRKSTPCVVNKMNWNTKEDKGMSGHDTCIVCTAVGENARLGTKRRRTVKTSLTHCRVMLGWRHQLVD